jgi:hypothetical protein
LQAVKERRQKTVAAKQAELLAELREQSGLLQTAINERVSAAPCPFIGVLQLGSRQCRLMIVV